MPMLLKGFPEIRPFRRHRREVLLSALHAWGKATDESQQTALIKAHVFLLEIWHKQRQLEQFWPPRKARKVKKTELYVALDFDGVLHSTELGPLKQHCADYAAGRINAEQFLETVNRERRARYGLTSDNVDFLFDRAAFFSSAFRDLGRLQVRLVIGTSWRNTMQPEALRALLPPILDERVVGVLSPHDEEHREPGTRARLMQDWIAKNAPHARWLAVDDDAELWEGAHSRLVQTRRGGLDGPTWRVLRDICESVAANNGRFNWMFEDLSVASD
ncbi:HAD domain-containing protein [Variovorax robiniae]|uniref:HAD domain-containing protein n=1 Tax=Variovorax robiniae TaxID=1836199 RepID=A0ABU8X814_9BURK